MERAPTPADGRTRLKTLTLLRHAKSGWDDPVARDFDRPLNAKGKRAAQAIGRHWRSEGLVFDHVVASPALRVQETLAAVEGAYGRPLSPHWDKKLYLASVEEIIQVVRALPSQADRALVSGHNPGLEELVLTLVADEGDQPLRDDVELKFPTASMAELTFAVADWGEIAPDGANLTRFVRPRDLDPSLGPED